MEQVSVMAPVLIVAFVFGLVVGSFLNVVIHRVPREESVVRPRSRCPGCRKEIAAWDNVPVLSFLWLRGKCRHCAAPISWRYPLVELTTGLVFAAIVWAHGFGPVAGVYALFAAGLLVAAGVDYDEQWIPDTVSLGGLAVGVVAMPVAHFLEGVAYQDALVFAVVGALLGGGFLWIVGFLHARLAVAMGREFEHWPGEGEPLPRPSSLDYWTWFPGLGFGDVKLMAMVGAFLGPTGVLMTIFLAAFIGLAVGLLSLLSSASLTRPFGFGPSIAAAAVVYVVVPALQVVSFGG